LASIFDAELQVYVFCPNFDSQALSFISRFQDIIPPHAYRTANIFAIGSTGIRSVLVTVEFYQATVSQLLVHPNSSNTESANKARVFNLIRSRLCQREQELADNRDASSAESIQVQKQWAQFGIKSVSRNFIKSMFLVWCENEGNSLCATSETGLLKFSPCISPAFSVSSSDELIFLSFFCRSLA